MKKAASGLSLLIMLIGITAHASVLGTPVDGGSQETELSVDAVYRHNEFMSSTVGKQTENYVEYTPDAEGIPMSVPVVVSGGYVYGRRDITEAAAYMRNQGMTPLMGINADFFASNGVPSNDSVINGKIISKAAPAARAAVGFRADGTAFIDYLGIKTSLSCNGKEIPIAYINKLPTDGNKNVFLLTDDFGKTTNTSHIALYVVCSVKEGELGINGTMKLNVKSVSIKTGAVKISAGDMIFAVDTDDGNAEYVNMLRGLSKGDELTLTNTVYGAERYDWTEAPRILSVQINGWLIRNGTKVNNASQEIAPRTAVGVKPNGNVIFYTIDGRQSGYSYGCSLSELADRLLELGCTDAINLDGGGSTSIGVVYPGSEDFTVVNKTSDKTLRKVSNFVFLRDLRGLSCNISFDLSGDEVITKEVSYGGAYPAMTVPERAGYVFEGYYSEENGAGTRYYDADCEPEYTRYKFTEDLTLYAYWSADDAVSVYADGAGSTYPHANDKTYDKEYPYTLSVSENASIATDEIEVTIGGVKADNSGFLKRKLGVITGGNVEFTAGIKGIPEGTTLENIECVVSVKYSLDGIPASQNYTFTLE